MRPEMRQVNRFPTRPTLIALGAVTLAGGLAACSSIDNMIRGDKLDYRSGAEKTSPLEVPPDLSQLTRDGRYQPQAAGGTVSASALGASAPAPAANTPAVAADKSGNLRIVRAGNQRWLATDLAPEAVWPQVVAFWQERGFTLAVQDAQAGVMETDWAENRAKIPDDIIRRTVGRVFDSLYSTGERDRFRTRIERTPTGSEIYISHRGVEEVFVGQQKETTTWTNRPSDPQLEAEFLSRLMVRLGAKEETAKQVAAAPVTAPARARLVAEPASALQVDEPFDRAWRRVGLSLDRSGFTVEDRDRAAGLYYVRYVDPKNLPKDDGNFFTRLFRFGRDADPNSTANRYRIALKADGERTLVSVQNRQGAPEASEVGRNIVNLLVDDLK